MSGTREEAACIARRPTDGHSALYIIKLYSSYFTIVTHLIVSSFEF